MMAEALEALACWWVWTARPFILHPIQTIRQWISPPPDIQYIYSQDPTKPHGFVMPVEKLRDTTEEDLASLTPEERKALQ